MTTMLSSSTDPLRTLETNLAGTLRPVSPPIEFVRRLKGSIDLPPRIMPIPVAGWRSLLVALVSVLAGFMVILTVARVIFHFLPRKREG